ncbi:MAG TPA: protein phosphatase 2C domain-containing protein [Anaerolineales bacterium]|nr:protein phosphatase 2C domain-containing protein [Anaerolineales bacterium]
MKKFVKRFRRKKGKSKTDRRGAAATVPLTQSQEWELAESRPGIKFGHLVVGSALDLGQRRENNEDALLSFSGSIGSSSGSQPFGIYMIADGMGGHRNGELASETAVRAMSTYLVGKLYKPLFGPEPQPANESLREIMEAAVLVAQKAVRKAAPGGGCTMTAAMVLGSQLIIAHMGDSRAYAITRDGRIEALTKDHSLVKRLQELGQLTEEEAANHPQKSVLYRALGQGENIQADIFTSNMPNPGSLLICSDGLWGQVDKDEIARIVNSVANPDLACEQLVEAANAAGGPDNISVILVRLVN